ncbi:helix-turn-helix domain-containing protein [Sulfurimonas denitrificans]|uniref:helix-turn-helix domain-containing protein n=1 Tax=Sulfurimonas denitrificans TaxID=39766 RepID=UPI003D3317EA
MHVKLTKQELSLVEILVQNIGQIVTLETIEFILWHDKAVTDGSRRQLLFRLKSKMQGVTIEVIKGVGYKLHKQ